MKPFPLPLDGEIHSSPSAKPKLAVISTYDELCGIAGYTIFLKKQLDEHYDVTVFDLDQFFLRHESRRVRRLGDQHIKDICKELPKFDYVNLQLEFGTIGRLDEDIIKRFNWLVKASPKLSVTFHTILAPENFGLRDLALGSFKGRPWTAWKNYRRALNSRRLGEATYAIIRHAQRNKDVSVIVHTRRDMRLMRYVHRLKQVHDHPLVFMSARQALEVTATASRSSFTLLKNVPDAAKLVGVFGFLGPYKSFETVIRAMQHLPDDHHLLIFGGIHPQTIRKEQKVDPYIRQLLSEAYVDSNVFERLSEGRAPEPGVAGLPASAAQRGVSVNLTIDSQMAKLLETHPKDLSRRVHFMGALPDEQFSRGMAICDTVVFPYLEVGQSSSGPISQAIELGKRIIASRTLAYMQLARYHANVMEFFDIGNHLELAQRIAADPSFPNYQKDLKFTALSNMAVYRAANGAVPASQDASR